MVLTRTLIIFYENENKKYCSKLACLSHYEFQVRRRVVHFAVTARQNGRHNNSSTPSLGCHHSIFAA
jgi:hypothetical protein